MNVAVDLQNPQQLRVGEVREGCTDWLLRQFSDAQGTKIRHYFDVVRGGAADDACHPASYLAVLPQRATRTGAAADRGSLAGGRDWQVAAAGAAAAPMRALLNPWPSAH